MKCSLGIHLTKGIQIRFTENYKILIRTTKEDLDKWTGVHFHELKDSVILRFNFQLSVMAHT